PLARGMPHHRPQQYVAGRRSYYENKGGNVRPGFIELHFVEEVLPGYFWIFELPNGEANVGIGMLSANIKKRGIHLKDVLKEVVSSRNFAARFADARPVGRVVGGGPPMGPEARPTAGGGWVPLRAAAGHSQPCLGV